MRRRFGTGLAVLTRLLSVACAVSLGPTLAACSADALPPQEQAAGAAQAGSPSTGGADSPPPMNAAGIGAAGAAGTGGALGGTAGGDSAGGGGAGAGGTSGGAPSGGSAGLGGSESSAGGPSGGAGAGGATAGNGGNAGGPAADLRATMVVRGAGTATAGDKVMIGRLEAFGFSKVTVVSDAAVSSDSVMGQDLVVISSSAESGPLKDKLKNVVVPVLCIEDAEFKLMGMASSGDHDAGTTQLQIISGGSALTGSASGTVTFSSSAGELGWGTPAPAAVKGATMLGAPDHVVIFGYEKGAQMVGMVAPARRAGFAIREALAANLNPAGIALFDAVLAWVMK